MTDKTKDLTPTASPNQEDEGEMIHVHDHNVDTASYIPNETAVNVNEEQPEPQQEENLVDAPKQSNKSYWCQFRKACHCSHEKVCFWIGVTSLVGMAVYLRARRH